MQKTYLIALLAMGSAYSQVKSYQISQVYRPHTFVVPEKSLQFNIGGTYYKTTGVYDTEGEFTKFEDATAYERVDYDFALKYGLSDRLELGIGGRYRQNKSTDANGDSISSAGIDSVYASAKYKLPNWNNFNLSVGLSARTMLNSSVDILATDEIEVGDEGNEFRIFGSAAYRLGKRIYLSTEVAFVKPGDDLSDEMNYDFSIFYAHKQFALGLGYKFVQSLGTDPYSDDPTQKPIKLTGNTATINSVDRTYASPYGAVNLMFTNKFQLEFRAGLEQSGQSWDERSYASMNVIIQTEGRNSDAIFTNKFKEYDLEGSVIKVSPRGRFVKLDKGLSSDVQKGMRIDFYQYDYLGGNVLVASGSVFEVALDSSIVKILKVFRDDIKVEKGFVARGRR